MTSKRNDLWSTASFWPLVGLFSAWVTELGVQYQSQPGKREVDLGSRNRWYAPKIDDVYPTAFLYTYRWVWIPHPNSGCDFKLFVHGWWVLHPLFLEPVRLRWSQLFTDSGGQWWWLLVIWTMIHHRFATIVEAVGSLIIDVIKLGETMVCTCNLAAHMSLLLWK